MKGVLIVYQELIDARLQARIDCLFPRGEWQYFLTTPKFLADLVAEFVNEDRGIAGHLPVCEAVIFIDLDVSQLGQICQSGILNSIVGPTTQIIIYYPRWEDPLDFTRLPFNHWEARFYQTFR